MAYVSGLPSFEKSQMLGMEYSITAANKSKGISHQHGITELTNTDTATKQASMAGANIEVSKGVGHLINVVG